jgi:hypothetical protein
MQRRAVLQSLTAVTAATATGLAGCSTSSESGPQCGTPGEDLESALPRGDGFDNPSVDSNNNASEVGGAREHVLGSYVSGDETHLFVIGRYDSEEAADTAASTDENWVTYGYATTGYLVVGEYAYVAMGPNESSVTDLMAAAGPLNDHCARERIVFL